MMKKILLKATSPLNSNSTINLLSHFSSNYRELTVHWNKYSYDLSFCPNHMGSKIDRSTDFAVKRCAILLHWRRHPIDSARIWHWCSGCAIPLLWRSHCPWCQPLSHRYSACMRSVSFVICLLHTARLPRSAGCYMRALPTQTTGCESGFLFSLAFHRWPCSEYQEKQYSVSGLNGPEMNLMVQQICRGGAHEYLSQKLCVDPVVYK